MKANRVLILNHLPVYHWAIGGLGLATVTLLMLWLTNKRLGISTAFENLCSLVVRVPYFQRDELGKSHSWRLPFLGGLVFGGALSALLGGEWQPLWALGMFDTRLGWGAGGKVAWMFAGGVLIGAGTRMAGGCTSGHGIFGLSNFEKSGLVSTLCFMVAGLITTNLIYRVIGG